MSYVSFTKLLTFGYCSEKCMNLANMYLYQNDRDLKRFGRAFRVMKDLFAFYLFESENKHSIMYCCMVMSPVLLYF
ncbi:hypothetical protein BpHYR1_035260 [Brachionus plicatilis]|uniref:Uncharacterized protein n=1 Tax=Brachionus plicatilis TaxID=10195 RepID=A0A3M7SB17_BRAPC|nr:hypothetical protein BpHYR1_035260 [Brachionus plicatilis]